MQPAARQPLGLVSAPPRRLMKHNRLHPVWRRRRASTTDSRHELPVSPNVLQRRFDPDGPDQAWVSDITCIRTGSGWLYLAAVMDFHARKIVGRAIAAQMPASLVCQALQMTVSARRPKPGLIVHSDRESQYASAMHQELLARHGLVGSMSRKSNRWDNAQYIVGSYNARRLHSGLGNVSPSAFEQKLA